MEKNTTIKSKTIKNGIIAMLALMGAFIITGCTFGKGGTSPVYYGYNVQNIDHCGFFYISKTTYYGNRVEFDVNSRYDISGMTFSTPDDPNATVDFNNNTVILYSDIPNDITSLEVSNGWFEVSFRYLNTSEYACIWRSWADDLGWVEYEGDKDKYYTEEEKEQQREAAERAEELRKQAEKEDEELFAVFQGKWVSEDGDYFDIYDAGSSHGFTRHGVRYYQNDNQYTEQYDGFKFSKYGQENTYRMIYTEGGWGIQIAYDIEYDGGNSFLYAGKEFTRVGEGAETQKSNRTREYFDNLDKETSYDKIVEDLGPCGFRGSGIIYNIWQLDDGTEARVVFDSEGKIVMIYIADEDNNVERIYKRE